MKEIHELREKLCNELKEYGKKEMSAGSLDVIDKLAHSIKNIDKILEKGEGYSGRYNDGRSYEDGRSYGRDTRGLYSGYMYDDMRR